MRKVVLLEHLTLDGFLCGPNGEMDWIRVDDEMWDYVDPLTAAADAAIFGRVTYQMMAGYWPTAANQPGATKHDVDHSRWVNSATKLVFSRTLSSVDWANSEIVSGDLDASVNEIKQRPGKDLLLIGSIRLARDFIEHGLVDEFRLNLNPVILGGGQPLFQGMGSRTDLRLMGTKTFASGVVAFHYVRQR